MTSSLDKLCAGLQFWPIVKRPKITDQLTAGKIQASERRRFYYCDSLQLASKEGSDRDAGSSIKFTFGE